MAIADLRRDGWSVDEVPTHPDQHVTDKRIADAAAAEHAIIASGGDGTANLVLNSLYTIGLHRNYFAVNPAGNANDISRNLHGDAAIEKIMRGRPMAAYALKTTVQFQGDTVLSKYAAGYAGIGGAGRASRWLDTIKRWPAHTALEPLAAWVAAGRHQLFTLHPHPSTGDAAAISVTANDLSVAKADIMAKYGHTGADIFAPRAKAVYSRRRGMGATLLHMLRLKNGRLPGDDFDGALSFRLETARSGTALTMFHDGEPYDVPDGAIITFAIADRPYWTLRPHQTPVSQRDGDPVS